MKRNNDKLRNRILTYYSMIIMILFLSLSITISIQGSAISPSMIRLEIPQNLHLYYTMNYSIPIEYFYVDDTNNGIETHFIFTDKNIESNIKLISKKIDRFKYMISNIQNNNYTMIEKILQNNHKTDWLYYSLLKYQNYLLNSQVCIFGSMEPTFELISIILGANNVTTIEYNNLTYHHEQIQTISKYNFSEFYNDDSKYINYFDIALSISSFDHDGLGRYGDPFNPYADINAMKNVMKILKPGGILILTIPIGSDLVVFNLHRRYGAIRLPLLLEGWNVIEKLFWNETKLYENNNFRQSYEPIIILQKPLSIENNNNNNISENITESNHLNIINEL